MIEGMTVDRCYRAMHLERRPEDHGSNNLHGTFGTLTFFKDDEETVVRWQKDRAGKDGRFEIKVITYITYPGKVVAIADVDESTEPHLFKLLRRLEVEEGAVDVTVTAVTVGINPRVRA